MPGEIGVAQAMAGRGDLARSSACRPGSGSVCDPAPARACRTRPGTCGSCRRRAASGDSNNAAPRPRRPRRPGSWWWAAGGRPDRVGHGRGTVTARPSTFTLMSTGGGLGRLGWDCGCGMGMLGSAAAAAIGGFRRRDGVIAAPRATNSSLNLATKLCTGQEQASPKAQMVRPPGMLSAMCSR
jgi:hypothetical protein